MSFQELGLAPKLSEVLDSLKFNVPTPIQRQAIPQALDGDDIIGIAQTGTGKTMAFSLPMVQHLASNNAKGLILVPTRELAVQVEESVNKIARPFQIRTVVLIGGESFGKQFKDLSRKPRIIIATPGRLIDLMEQKKVHLKDVKILVLDEADRMLDMGFAPQIERILKTVPTERQTMLFSATMPPEIVRMASKHMHTPVHVEIAPAGTTAEHVTHELFIVNQEMKKALLRKLLDQYRGSVLLFCRTKMGAKRAAMDLRKNGFAAAEIHSDRSLKQRQEALEGFKKGKYRILAATDIAARGIDVKNISLVINYDLPDELENYVHRIGRTGRAGVSGHAISFARPDQRSEVICIERLIKSTVPISKHPDMPDVDFHKPQTFSFSSRRRGGPVRRRRR